MSNNSTDFNIHPNSYTVTRVKFRSFDVKLLNLACSNLVELVKNIGGRSTGPIQLPTSKHYYCVLNSPHVYKKSREHFEIAEYRRLLDVYIPKNVANVSDFLVTIPIPAGVLAEIVS